jgi:hypothetical protein
MDSWRAGPWLMAILKKCIYLICVFVILIRGKQIFNPKEIRFKEAKGAPTTHLLHMLDVNFFLIDRPY